MNKITTFITALIVCASFIIKAQNVYIPDVNFKKALLSDTLINTNKDTAIQVSEAAAYKNTINVGSMNIKDLTGIEAFTDINTLYCMSNNLTSLNLSSNTTLTTLICTNNKLTTLDVSKNTSLTVLNCATNQLKTFDVSNDTSLTLLLCETNQLTALDVSKNTALTKLNCFNNQLTSLNVSTDTALTTLDCSNNQLIYLNLQNGAYTKLTKFSALNNHSLSCIQVSNASYMNANYLFYKDPATIFSTNCNYTVGIDNTTNTNFSIYPNPANNLVTFSGIAEDNKTITITNLVGETVQTETTKGASIVTMHLSNLPVGLYFISLGERSYKFFRE